jgi:hypothetical protein
LQNNKRIDGISYPLTRLFADFGFPLFIFSVSIKLKSHNMEVYKNLSLENLPDEEWRDIKGYEGLYQVSNMGRVKSLSRPTKRGKGIYVFNDRILCNVINGHGYCQVSIFDKEGVFKIKQVHRLVAEAFIPNPNNHPFIDHIDTVKTNNIVSNLRWCTQSMNMNNPITKEYIDSKRLEFCREEWYIETQRYSQPHSKCVLQYSLNGDLIARWRTISEAARSIGASVQAISRCCNGVVKTSMNYIWKFE